MFKFAYTPFLFTFLTTFSHVFNIKKVKQHPGEYAGPLCALLLVMCNHCELEMFILLYLTDVGV